jgi:hypothetical protein
MHWMSKYPPSITLGSAIQPNMIHPRRSGMLGLSGAGRLQPHDHAVSSAGASLQLMNSPA